MFKHSLFICLVLIGLQVLADNRRLTRVFFNDSERETVVHLSSCEGNRDRFDAVKIRVGGDALLLDRISLRYENGALEDLRLPRFLAKGAESRWIRLRGGERCISDLLLIGQEVGERAAHPFIEIWGSSRDSVE